MYFHKRQKYLTVGDWFFGLFIILIFVIITDAILNINLNQFGNKIRNLGLINIYENKNLNGLLSLGFIIAGLSFIYDMFFKKATTEVEENGREN
ncbi:preprotein translocase subunit SecY [Staphylococcus cohnii]|uniref:preprotein translocase subunit SecY n=1 Tax=Staphylococcus cohnii TaxID=29382 RepID=UPI00374F0209